MDLGVEVRAIVNQWIMLEWREKLSTEIDLASCMQDIGMNNFMLAVAGCGILVALAFLRTASAGSSELFTLKTVPGWVAARKPY
jgi:hypothetical protein